ncbi:MAG: ABC transporter substrate-binding protein [Geminicoccaceae bacterium]|jgi:peptide/nickel transport system substrate-binding protein|nr:ABC transporter substrate-binding protein [Geminicoccaceae bacterium]MCB9969495.1 ABC transporter substrate-binding protein [Geminicoccaceae bacterium]HRY23015.1 ABC transporter substrate-binding protein [Geminicoccaceae bacterium]
MTARTVLLGALLVLGPAVAGSEPFKEAPELAALVAEGKLPPVDERLPTQPLVVSPLSEIGTYGGTWRSALKGASDTGWLRRTVAYDPLVAYSFDWDDVVPNVALSVDVNDDASEFVFHLREGHKWSDGTPFTAHDLEFAITDAIQIPEYFGASRNTHLLGAKATAVDDLTLKIELPEPNGLFLKQMASVSGMWPLMYQEEYCSQFHIKYNPDADAEAKSAGLTGWPEALYLACDLDNWRDTERPTLLAWKLTSPYDGLSQQVTFERNPYYFKVDSASNQLPYLDSLQMRQSSSVDDMVLQALNGDIDFMDRHIATTANKPLFIDGQAKGDYRLFPTVQANMNTSIIQLNQNSENPALNALFNEHDFRVALSLAIDRQEIIDVLFVGQGEPWQASPRPESRWHNERLAKQHTEFDPDRANALLDGLGLTGRDAEGFRLGPDGKRIAFRLDVTSDVQPTFPDVAEMLAIYWRALGIQLDVRKSERSFVYETMRANRHDAHIWQGDGGLGDAILDPRYYFPANVESVYALLWAKSLYDPGAADALEPPPAVRRQQDLYRELQRSADPVLQDQLFAEILEIAADEFRVIGISLPPNGYGIARNDMGNVPELQPHSWIYPTPGPMGVAQLFHKRG